jgi:hypothetical protein
VDIEKVIKVAAGEQVGQHDAVRARVDNFPGEEPGVGPSRLNSWIEPIHIGCFGVVVGGMGRHEVGT